MPKFVVTNSVVVEADDATSAEHLANEWKGRRKTCVKPHTGRAYNIKLELIGVLNNLTEGNLQEAIESGINSHELGIVTLLEVEEV